MRRRSNRTCTYAIALDGEATRGDVQTLAQYFSTLNLAGCEVLVFDASPGEDFEEHARVLRWVARHVALQAGVDLLHASAELAASDKIIFASRDARYAAAEIGSMCQLLELHDIVEPEEYFDPLPWWGGLDAGRILLHRGVDQHPRRRSTFAFRRAAFVPPRGVEGAEIYEARGVFVRREPLRLRMWLRQRPDEAVEDLASPMKSAFFLALLPLLLILAILGGRQMAWGSAGMVASAAVILAARGRIGAAKFFPLRACLFAPLWIAERSISVYWALFDRLRHAIPSREEGEESGRRFSGLKAQSRLQY